MRLAIVLAALALSACSTVRYATVPCLNQQQLEELRNAEPEKVGPKLTGQAQEDFKIVAGSAIELRSWGRGMLGVLSGCVG
jgi:hypothetical protein